MDGGDLVWVMVLGPILTASLAAWLTLAGVSTSVGPAALLVLLALWSVLGRGAVPLRYPAGLTIATAVAVCRVGLADLR